MFEHTRLFFGCITETKLVDVWGREDNRGTWKMINDLDHIQTQNHNYDDAIEGDITNPVSLDGTDTVTSGVSSGDEDGVVDCTRVVTRSKMFYVV